MRPYIGLALYAEGPTDYHFLRPLLLRLTVDLSLRSERSVEIAEQVIALDHPPVANEAARDVRIAAAARLARGAWSIAFIHTDGATDATRARRELAQPAIDRLATECAEAGVGVAVIPVRETEAWALVDGDALRTVFGCRLDDAQLGLPQPRRVESLADPKAVLNHAFAMTNPSPHRCKQGVAPLLNALGETVSIDALRRLRSFQSLEDELKEALRALHVLR